MGKTRRKDKTFDDDKEYGDLHDYVSRATTERRGRSKKNKSHWHQEDELDDGQHESFQKIGKRK